MNGSLYKNLCKKKKGNKKGGSGIRQLYVITNILFIQYIIDIVSFCSL